MALIKCPECEGSVSDRAEFCPHCGFPLLKNNETTENRSNETKVIEKKCPICKSTKAIYSNGAITCSTCGFVIEVYDEQKFDNHVSEIYKNKHDTVNIPKCPMCGSTDISPISTGERAMSIIGLGIFSKKINKSFKCNNPKCKYTW